MKRRGWRNEVAPRPVNPRAVRASTWAVALGLGLGLGVFQGEALLARAFPERAARLRLAVVGHAEAAPLELADAAGVGPGSRLAALDLDAVAAGLATHPWVASARVAAFPPDWLLVAVEERTPVAVARIGTEAWLVDAQGVAFLPAPDGAPLPVLVGAASREDAGLAEGVAWLAALGAHGLPAPRELQLAAADATRAPALALAHDAPAPDALVLLGAGERDAKLARLAKLFAARVPELAAAAEIDLRFGADVILRPRPPDPTATAPADAEFSQSATNSEGAG